MPVEAHKSRENKVPRSTFQTLCLIATCEMARVLPGVFQAAVLCFSGFAGIHFGAVFSDSDSESVHGCLVALQSQQLKAPHRRMVELF